MLGEQAARDDAAMAGTRHNNFSCLIVSHQKQTLLMIFKTDMIKTRSFLIH
jgi:hypothetical protein